MVSCQDSVLDFSFKCAAAFDLSYKINIGRRDYLLILHKSSIYQIKSNIIFVKVQVLWISKPHHLDSRQTSRHRGCTHLTDMCVYFFIGVFRDRLDSLWQATSLVPTNILWFYRGDLEVDFCLSNFMDEWNFPPMEKNRCHMSLKKSCTVLENED